MAAFWGAIYFKNVANTVANKGGAFMWNGMQYAYGAWF